MPLRPPLEPRGPAPSLLLALALGLAGCELVAYADRDRIPSTTGGAGGEGGSGGGGGAGTSSASSASSGAVACVLPADCPGGDTDCTVRTCVAGACGAAHVAKDTPTTNQVAGDCKRAVCDGKGAEILVDDDLDVPVDGEPCTDDRCAAGVPSNPPSGAGAACAASGGKVCDGAGACVACVVQADCDSGLKCVNNACVTCFDLKKDGTETDVDCGGTCSGCGPGGHCAGDADCAGASCVAGACAPTCTDAVKNGDETDADCGGTCPDRCADGKGCALPADCASDVCAAGKCLAATCADGTLNGGESDVDCGGPCSPCADGRPCNKAADCASKVCSSGACAAPTCTDLVQNGGETDKDCGGGCPPCAIGAHCGQHADCASSVCLSGVCAAPSCFDTLENEGESDVDCGGPCAPCPGGKKCGQAADCASTVCSGGLCTTPTCTDTLKNGSETDVDCGGPTCPPCALGEGCQGPLDCVTVACNGLVCVQPTCADVTKNGMETGVDCGGPSCPPCGAGQGCEVDADCAAPNTCGGGSPGTPGVCGCTADPLAITCAGVACGSAADNCGTSVSCGGCAAPLTCGGGGTPGACGCALPGGCLLNTVFAMRFGGFDDDDGFGISVNDTGVLLGGSTVTSIDFGGGTMVSAGADDAYAARFSQSGSFQWSKHWGDQYGQFIRACALDPAGNAFLGAELYGTVDFGDGPYTALGSTDMAMVKLDPAGNLLWSRPLGDPNAQAVRGVGTDAAGNVYFTGAYLGAVDFGGGLMSTAGGSDVYVVKLTGSGGFGWARVFGDATSQTATALAADAAGNTAVTGLTQGTVDFGGGPVVTGGGGDAYVVVLDPNGAYRWAKAFGDAALQLGNGVAIDSSGNVAVAGASKGSIDFGGGPLVNPGGTAAYDAFVAVFDATGNHLWSKRLGDAADQQANAVAFDPSGNVLVTGGFAGVIDCGTGPITSAGATDVFVVKYSPTGTCLQARRYGDADAQPQTGRGITTDSSGNVYVIGDFWGTLDVDVGPITSADMLDVFFLKLTP